MRILKRVSSLQRHLGIIKSENLSIGFVPTMGALHNGHISLINKSNVENDVTVCSIYVNPTQFNQKDDLEKYPRNLDKDASLLHANGCDYLFAPPSSQVYPKNLKTNISLDISALTSVMEGPNRPGHFEGVVQVVKRLLDIVGPNKLYMGQKDFQQFTIVNYMLKELEIPTTLRVCPIIREDDGLAMSSRNVRLREDLRPECSILYKSLLLAKEKIDNTGVETIENEALEMLSRLDFKPEYFSIVDGYTLKPIENAHNSDYIVACTAVWVGNVRLIDNMILRGENKIR